MLPLIYVALFLQVGSLSSGLAGSPCPSNSALEAHHRQEIGLFDFPLDRTILRSLPIWDQQTGGLREPRAAELFDDSTPVLILHLWATWCGPCKEEFALWRELGPRLGEQHKGGVRVAHIALQENTDKVPAFISELQGKLPSGRLYFDRGERLVGNIRRWFNSNRMPSLPVTLWLDSDRVVRHAIVGPINNRLPEVVDATARLVRSLQEAARRPKPPEAEIDVFTKE